MSHNYNLEFQSVHFVMKSVGENHMNKSQIIFGVVLACCFILGACGKEERKPLLEIDYVITDSGSQLEKVVVKEMVNKNGLVKTDLTKRKTEYLAESQGLLMLYFVMSDDRENFDKSFRALKQSFLLPSNVLSWQIIDNKTSQTNALIDDFRVIEALYKAQLKWRNQEQQSFLTALIEGNKKYTMKNGYFVDFGHQDEIGKASVLTLSYADPLVFRLMELPSEQLEKNTDIIRNALQDKNGLYAKKYELKNNRYQFDDEVHMVDQLLTAINVENAGVSTESFHDRLKDLVGKSGKLYGQYDRKTMEPVVSFESPAVYSYAILYSRLIKDKSIEKLFENNLQQLKNAHQQSPFYGAFIEEYTKKTHSFDNLLPLIVEL